jgi:hypothetical protein
VYFPPIYVDVVISIDSTDRFTPLSLELKRGFYPVSPYCLQHTDKGMGFSVPYHEAH